MIGCIILILGGCQPTTPVSITPFTAPVGCPDPQIAVGRKYFAALSTSYVAFYDKSTLQPLSGSSFVYPQNPVSATAIFQQFFVIMDKQMGLPLNVCDPNNPQNNITSAFDPANPNKSVPGSIVEAYDTRVMYDDLHHRFWIESAVRNHLWQCGSPPSTGANIGGFDSPPGSKKWIDPDPSDPTQIKCHKDWNSSWAHRFIAIAVSQVDANGNEDLSKPFHQYALVDDYNDWPQMTVNDNYLILNHKDANDYTLVFDAQALANGQQDNTCMAVAPLLKINYNQFSVPSGTNTIQATDAIYPVNSHGPSNNLTYLVSSAGNNLLIFALKSPANNLSGKPTLLSGAAIDLGHQIHLRTNPVYRDGKLYIASFECVTSANNVCTKYYSRVIRVPVSLNANGTTVQAQGNNSPDFLDYIVGNLPGDLYSYEIPSIEVTQAKDMVLVYEKVGLDPSQLQPASVYFRIFYHDNLDHVEALKVNQGNQFPSPLDPEAGGVDLGGIALDPSDGLTVWMSHAYSNNGVYTEIVGNVKP
jgi:hypothetical protein